MNNVYPIRSVRSIPPEQLARINGGHAWDGRSGDDFIRSDGRTRLGTAPRVHLAIRKRTDWRTVLDLTCKAIIILFGIASLVIWGAAIWGWFA